MSGHSHAKTIAHKKGIADQKRGNVFSKMSKIIAVAAKGGTDPNTNYKLKQALEEAKKFNMPKENIERAVKRGSGGAEEMALEEVCYEVFGPGGTAIIIEGITDNKNRAMLEIKQILQKNGAKVANEGSLKWLFERKGIIGLIIEEKDKEETELKAIEAGADDIRWYKEENFLEILTKPENLEKIKKALEEQGLKIESSNPGWIAKEEISISEKDKQSCETFFEELEESDTVQNVFSNLKD